MLKSLPAWTLLIGTACAAEPQYQAIANADAALRNAPSVTAGQSDVVPKGTQLSVEVCFDEGTYCAVSNEGYNGYVAGDLLTIEGDSNTVLSAERAKWELIRKNREASLSSDFEAGHIVVWGDSLSYETFGDELARLLPGRLVSMQGVPGQDGRQIAERMLADTLYTNRFKVIWDRHWSNETPEQYLTELKPILTRAEETGDFIILSDIRQLIPGGNVDPTIDRATTEAINGELARLYPSKFLDVTGLLDAPAMRAEDGLHLSAAGNSAVAKALAKEIAARQPAPAGT